PEHHKRIRQCFALLRTALAEELHGHDPFANSVMSPVMPALACCRCINVVTGDLRSPRPPRRKR
ncbi:hypothetical protein, partial [Streptomyces niveiscabiei]|uniref:hypothetical protein n=1 Tax=Streptomyces niveiscabiei TaxID=164115 RepID=UPI0038F7642C